MNKGLREVIFIEGLKTKKVMATDCVEYISAQGMAATALFSEGTALMDQKSQTVDRHVVPVTTFFGIRDRQADTHIAYSQEVEELLGVPVRILLKEAKESKALSRAYQADSEFFNRLVRSHEASLWRRLKFLFTGHMVETTQE